MLACYANIKRTDNYESVPLNQTINKIFYLQVLKYEFWKQVCPKGTKLCIDKDKIDAPSHTEHLV
jgi:hypothetical protein